MLAHRGIQLPPAAFPLAAMLSARCPLTTGCRCAPTPPTAPLAACLPPEPAYPLPTRCPPPSAGVHRLRQQLDDHQPVLRGAGPGAGHAGAPLQLCCLPRGGHCAERGGERGHWWVHAACSACLIAPACLRGLQSPLPCNQGAHSTCCHAPDPHPAAFSSLLPPRRCSCPALPPPAGVILCWVGLFAPGIIIIFGILPFWGTFRWAPGRLGWAAGVGG